MSTFSRLPSAGGGNTQPAAVGARESRRVQAGHPGAAKDWGKETRSWQASKQELGNGMVPRGVDASRGELPPMASKPLSRLLGWSRRRPASQPSSCGGQSKAVIQLCPSSSFLSCVFFCLRLLDGTRGFPMPSCFFVFLFFTS